MKHNNTTLEHENEVDKCKNCREYLEKFIKENDIKGRIRWDDGKRATHLLTSCVITLSTEAYQKMTKEERDEYFKDGLEYFKECYPDYKILDATIHRDEGYIDEDGKWQKGLDHLQICAIPLYYNKEKDQYEISTTKAEKAHLIREMEREGRDTSHVDLREQRQYLHDRFVDHNREKGRDFDYKSQEGKQTRYNVKLFKKLQNQHRAMRREKEKLEKEREEIEKDKLNNAIEKQRNAKANEINKKNYAIVQAKENKNNDKSDELDTRENDLNARETALDLREKEIEIKEQQQNLYRTYFDYREDYCNRMDVTGYAYEKALRVYERTGDVKYDYYSSQDCKDYIGTIYPEVINPDRSIEEKEAISKQCENVEKDRNYYLIPEKLITHLETKEPEKEERSLDDLLDRADKKYDRGR